MDSLAVDGEKLDDLLSGPLRPDDVDLCIFINNLAEDMIEHVGNMLFRVLVVRDGVAHGIDSARLVDSCVSRQTEPLYPAQRLLTAFRPVQLSRIGDDDPRRGFVRQGVGAVENSLDEVDDGSLIDTLVADSSVGEDDRVDLAVWEEHDDSLLELELR